MTEASVVAGHSPTNMLIEQLRSGSAVVVSDEPLDPGTIKTLVETAARPGVATASPVPVAGLPTTRTYPCCPTLPPAPSLALPNPRLCAIDPAAIASLQVLDPAPATASAAVVAVGEQLLLHGWRHVAAPGVAADWDPRQVTPSHTTAGWTVRAVSEMAGPSNVGLETHITWARTQINGVAVVIDGACITDAPFTGTQQLVVEIARWLRVARPAAQVALAVGRGGERVAERLLTNSGVDVIRRRPGVECDVLYRPYQMLFARELDFVKTTACRTVVGQLDMIGFSNPFYHPSDMLWFFARNLQRHLMRTADAVTFISHYGLSSALAECPDLEPRRLFVVSCGADPVMPPPGPAPRDWRADGRFITCLSSSFSHKNREHAIAVFERAVVEHDYDGHLIIAGPEPFYGRSSDDERALIEHLPERAQPRVHRWGHISDADKWWLLRNSDVVLYPSVVEGFGLVPFEAAAAGSPCLVYDGTAPSELLQGTGAAIDSWLPSAWASRVADLVASPEARAALVIAVAEAGRLHSWRDCAELTWSAIDSTLAMPRQSGQEEGGRLAAVGSKTEKLASAASLRFDAARGWPAMKRRVQKLRPRHEDGS